MTDQRRESMANPVEGAPMLGDTVLPPLEDDEKGGKADWAIEGRTPGQLLRSGWSKSSLKIGDVITIDFSPAKDGTRTGLLTRVTRADGTVLGQAPAAQ